MRWKRGGGPGAGASATGGGGGARSNGRLSHTRQSMGDGMRKEVSPLQRLSRKKTNPVLIIRVTTTCPAPPPPVPSPLHPPQRLCPPSPQNTHTGWLPQHEQPNREGLQTDLPVSCVCGPSGLDTRGKCEGKEECTTVQNGRHAVKSPQGTFTSEFPWETSHRKAGKCSG